MEFKVIEHFARNSTRSPSGHPITHKSVYLDTFPKIGDILNHLVRLDDAEDQLKIIDIDSGELHVQSTKSPPIEIYKSNYDSPGCNEDGEYE